MNLSEELAREIRVLIVEDEADAAEIIAALLEHSQVTADHVSNAEEAYHTLMQVDYDAVIVDLFLPGMDGLELIRRIRQQPRLAALPCIAVTAYTSSAMKKRAYEAGCNRYYSKPLDSTELARGMRELLG
jgi:CheY-like chemotaxis protein